MKLNVRIFLRILGVLVLIATGVLFLIGRADVQSEESREEANWAVSGAEANEIRPTVPTTEATTTTSPPTTVPETEPQEVPTTVRRTTTTTAAPMTTTTLPPTTTTVPLPVPPAQVATDQVFGRVNIPRLGIPNEAMPVLPLLEGYADDDPNTKDQVLALDSGTSHWPGTSLPGGGGNVVIGGHRTTHMRPFYELDTMQQGDEIEIVTDWGTYTYRVYRVELMVPGRPGPEAEALIRTYVMPQLDRPGETITVYTCTPTDSSSHRIIVQGDLIRVNGIDV